MPTLTRYGKVTCESCGTQTTKPNLAFRKKRCSAGTLYHTQCSNFSRESHKDLNYLIAKKHSAAKLDVTFKFKLCYQDFSGFYASRQHRNTQHAMQIRSRTEDVDVEHLVEDVEDYTLRENLHSCQHFFGGFGTRKHETQSIQLRSGNTQRNNRERETIIFATF